MANSITTREIISWGAGLLISVLTFSVKMSIDNATKRNEELKSKVDKIYDYATNHEVRMILIEKQLADHDKKILDLQLAQERFEQIDINSQNKKNQTNLQPK